MQEQNKNRLGIITRRYASREASRRAGDRAAFDEAFRQVREEVIRPILEEIAAELEQAGHAPRVSVDESLETPSIELHLGIQGRASANLVSYAVIARREAPEVLAYLDVSGPALDLVRHADPREITPESVEQLVVDAVEHIFACNAAA